MKRLHAFEFEDLPWVPRAIRDGGRDLFDTMFARMRFYRGCAPALLQLINDTGITRLSDVCSGSGGGAMAMRRELDAPGRNDVQHTDDRTAMHPWHQHG